MAELVEQESKMPTRKVQNSSLTGAGTAFVGAPVLVLWLWDLIMPERPMSAEVAVALGGIVTWAVMTVVGYMTKSRASDA